MIKNFFWGGRGGGTFKTSSPLRTTFALCMIKSFRGEGVVDGEGVAVKGA